MLTRFLLLCLPLTIFASECHKQRTHLECVDLSLDQLLVHYDNEEILQLNNFTSEVTTILNDTQFKPVNTIQIANGHLDYEVLQLLTSLPHLSTLQFENSIIDFKFNHSNIFLNPSLRNVRLVNSLKPTKEVLNFTFLSELDLSNNIFYEIPKISGDQIIYLNLSRTSLRNVKNLEKLPSLEELDLSNNSLRFVPNNAFDKNFDLERLNLQYNSLKSINFNATNLLTLYLDSNDLRIINGEFFVNIQSLTFLSITKNNIVELDKPFKYLKYLKNVDLSFNQLDNLNGSWFENTLELESLKISDNEISFLTDLTYVLPNLHYLDISNNAIRVLNDVFFDKTPALAILDASHNQIRIIDSSLTYLENLNKLYIAYNLLEIQRDTFANALQLNTLNASHNDIYTTLDVFKYNKQLRDVDLSYNAIGQLCEGNKAPSQILNLNICHNKVDNIDCLSQLTSFEVEGNPLKCNHQLRLKLKELLEGEVDTLKQDTTPLKVNEVEVFGEAKNWAVVLKTLCPDGIVEKDIEKENRIDDALGPVLLTSNIDSVDNGISTLKSSLPSDQPSVPDVKTIERDDTDDATNEYYDEADSDDDDDDDDDDDVESQRESMADLNVMLKKILHRPSHSWINWAYILTGVCVVLLLLNWVLFLRFRLRERANARLGSDRPYEQLNNEVYKDTTSRVESNGRSPNFGQAISTFKNEKLGEILAKFGFRTIHTDSESKVCMIPSNQTV